MQIDICESCQKFRLTCNGEQWKSGRMRGGRKKSCLNSQAPPNNLENSIQVLACQSLYITKVRCGMDRVKAFTEAVCQTSDDVWAVMRVQNKDMIEEFTNGQKIEKVQEEIEAKEGRAFLRVRYCQR